MSLFGVIERFATPGTASRGQYIVTRTAPGTYPAGEYAPGATTTITITASVQPFDGRHTEVLPEGVRTEDVREIWTATELHVDDATGTPDIITIPGGLVGPVEAFYVFSISGPWTLGGKTAYHVRAARRKKP